MGYRLVVSKEIEFDFRFTLREGSADKEFGFRVAAIRTAPPDPKILVGEYLEKHANVRMVSWLGDRAPIETEDGQVPEPGPDALAAMYKEWEYLPGLVFQAYRDATGPKAKLGN